MGSNLWRGYLAVVVVVTQFYFVSAFGASPNSTLYTVIGAIAVVAMLIGIWVHRPRHIVGWLLCAVGLALFLAGDFVYAQLSADDAFVPFPSSADWLYLAMYPVLAAGLVLLGRGLSPLRTWAAVAAGVAGTAIAAGGLYVVYMGDYIAEPFFDTRMRVVAVAYPLLDAVLIGVAVWLVVIARARSASLMLIALSLAWLVIGNAVYNYQSIEGSFAAGGPADVLWIGFTALLAMGCLHPSMASTPVPPRENTPPESEHERESDSDSAAREVTASDSVFAAIDQRILLDLPAMPDHEPASSEPVSSL